MATARLRPALLAANTINIAADLAGMADAAAMLSGINSRWFVVPFALLISWATVRLRYYQIASVLKWLVLVLFAYPITAFVVVADWGRVVRDTLVPSMPHTRNEWSTLVAILGTTISPYLFFWQASEEVEEEKAAGQSTLAERKGATRKELGLRRMDVGVGTFFSNVADQVTESAHQASRAACAVADAIEDGVGVVRRAAKQGGDAAEEFLNDTTKRLQRNPALTVATTFVVGFTAGALIVWMIKRR